MHNEYGIKNAIVKANNLKRRNEMIKNRSSGKIIFEDKTAKSVKREVEIAIKTGTDLSNANLSGANLRKMVLCNCKFEKNHNLF